MKKILIFVLAACLLLSLAGCQTGDEDKPEGTTAGAVSPSGSGEGNSTDPSQGTADGFKFTYKGVEITMHAPAEPIIDALGEPLSYTEQASCAFEGLDKTYYYGSIYIDTYPVEDHDFIYGFWFADDSVTTEEGIYIGASEAQVKAAYGEDSFNGSNAYITRKGDGVLTVILENGVVTSIQYSIVLG